MADEPTAPESGPAESGAPETGIPETGAPEIDVEALQEQLAGFDVDQFVVSATSTVASLAYAKLERRDLPQARKAIDVLAALVPLVEGELKPDLTRALASLQLAYAEAASA